MSGSLSHMMKVWENLKLAVQRCKVALPKGDTDDPSAVLRCTAAGSILVLWWSSIILYMLVWANKRAAPESIRALKHFPACTLTMGQSSTSPMESWFEKCSLHSLSSLLGEGSNSLKDQSHCLNLMKNLKGNPGW